MANMELKFLHSLHCRAILMKCLMVFILFRALGSFKISEATQNVSWFITSSNCFRLRLPIDVSSLNKSSTYLQQYGFFYSTPNCTIHKGQENKSEKPKSPYSVDSMFLKSSKSLMESWAATSMVLSCNSEIWLSLRRSWASSSEHSVSVSMLFFR